MQARRAAHARTVSALDETMSARTLSVDFKGSGSFCHNTNNNTTRYALIEQLELQNSEPVQNNNSWSV